MCMLMVQMGMAGTLLGNAARACRGHGQGGLKLQAVGEHHIASSAVTDISSCDADDEQRMGAAGTLLGSAARACRGHRQRGLKLQAVGEDLAHCLCSFLFAELSRSLNALRHCLLACFGRCVRCEQQHACVHPA